MCEVNSWFSAREGPICNILSKSIPLGQYIIFSLKSTKIYNNTLYNSIKKKKNVYLDIRFSCAKSRTYFPTYTLLRFHGRYIILHYTGRQYILYIFQYVRINYCLYNGLRSNTHPKDIYKYLVNSECLEPKNQQKPYVHR